MRMITVIRTLLLIGIATLPLPGHAAPDRASSPSTPIVRVELEEHVGVISSLAADASGRLLVSGADDKTVRLWELPGLKPAGILRPPIGEGHTGIIKAVAVTRDGAIVACGGVTNAVDRASYDIYLFDRKSLRMIARIARMPNEINVLKFSADGRDLLAGFSGKGGIKILRRQAGGRDILYSVYREDADYADSVHGADIDAQGRIVTSSLDGQIRLYDRDLKLIAKRRAPSGTRPYRVSFSPDGRKIAVGFIGRTPKVDVLSGSDLAPLYSPDTGGRQVPNGDVRCVAWSPDGRSLYGAGAEVKFEMQRQQRFYFPVVFKWPGEEKGTPEYIFHQSFGAITALQPLPDGRLACGSSATDLRIIDADGTSLAYKAPPIAYFRGDKQFQVSHDGSIVQFTYDKWRYADGQGRIFAEFSIPEKRLTQNPVFSFGLSPPATSSPELDIRKYLRTYDTTVNGKLLKFKGSQYSSCVAVAPGGKTFLLGSREYLYHFDAKGEEIWAIETPFMVYHLNVSGDGRYGVAALGDGSIRWYRMTDGKEILAFFPHGDRTRWALWTPAGYYDASEGGDELIGLNVNNDPYREASFFHIARYFEKLYQPQLITGALHETAYAAAVPGVMAQGPPARPTPQSTAAQKETALPAPGPAGDTPPSAPKEEPRSGVKPAEIEPPPAAVAQQEIPGTSPTDEPPRTAVEVAAAKPPPVMQPQTKPPPANETPAAATPSTPAAPGALSIASREEIRPPPRIAILKPLPGAEVESDRLEVTLAADSDEEIGEIRLFHNGKVLSTPMTASKQEGTLREYTYTIGLIEGANLLKATAFNSNRVESTPMEITVFLRGAQTESDLHLVTVGINRYKNAELNLNYAETDARGIQSFFQSADVKKLFKNVHSYALFNEEATSAGIQALMLNLESRATIRDTVLLYLAGHGNTVGADWFFIPHEIVIPEDEDILRRDGISQHMISGAIKRCKAQKIFVVIDACKSGRMILALRSDEYRRALVQLARSTGTYIISSSTDKQYAAEMKSLGHGVFTYAVLEGLKGGAGKKKVTVEGLIHFLKERLPELTTKHRGAAQYPVSWGSGMDFPLALRD